MKIHDDSTLGEALRIDRRPGGDCWITIDRVDKHNALARSVLASLREAMTSVADDPATRFVVLRGAGDAYFAAGGDLRDLSEVRDATSTHAMADAARAALDSVRDCPVPVIAYLNGDALGGGAELAVACDMRLAARHARIGYIQSRMAITSAWGGGADLCTLLGPSRAMRMMSRAELVDADQALTWGLVDSIVDDGPDSAAATAFFKPLLACSPQVLRGIKAQTRAWRRGESHDVRRAIERDHLVTTWLHADHFAAADRFLNKAKT